ncbi:MAG: ImmA/IrrE family metallo-endopeptidase [Ruminococcus sp.]|nr:ImmA/IrrE family metallo-endopeptidase [Ruminococcus sp.]MBQ8906043.1 ImmA/IrrE family metallo-endopeptidase [Ruminococcus sp.]
MTAERIFALTQEMIRRHSTTDPTELAQARGIDIEFADLGALKGLYTVFARCRYIVVNEQLSEQMQRLVIAHELGHDLLHAAFTNHTFREFSLYDMTAGPEREANLFAANLLLPDDVVCVYASEGRTAAQIAQMLGVPEALVQLKLCDMNRRGFGFSTVQPPRGDFLR